MNYKQKLIAVLSLGLVCGVVYHSALARSTKPSSLSGGASLLAENNANQTPSNTDGIAAAQSAKPLPQSTNDGKTVLPQSSGDGKTVLPVGEGPDGKETIPGDGKETVGKEALPPIKELSITGQPQAVDPERQGPPAEFLYNNVNPGNSGGNPLLNPPNPVNVSGPVVSSETP